MTLARTGQRVSGAEVVGVMTAEAMTEVAGAAHPPVWGKSDHPRRYHHTLLKINNAHRPEKVLFVCFSPLWIFFLIPQEEVCLHILFFIFLNLNWFYSLWTLHLFVSIQ